MLQLSKNDSANNTVGNYPNRIPNISMVEMSNPKASYNHLECGGQLTNVTCTDMPVNGGS